MLHLMEVKRFLNAALECSVYHAPTDPGLTWEELVEAGKRAGYAEGELQDTIMGLQDNRTLSGKFGPDAAQSIHWSAFGFSVTPEYRNIGAFDFIYGQLNENLRQMGKGAAGLERKVLVERAVAARIARKDAEVALTIASAVGLTVEKGGVVRYKHGARYDPLPSQQRKIQATPHSAVRENAYRIVGDIVARRSDGRPTVAEPLDAFADALDGLGYGRFRTWWVQTVGELRRSDANVFPLSTLVLSAALVEGALTFVVGHAKHLGLGPLLSKDFDGDPRTWKIDNLVASAARGSDQAILDGTTRSRAEELIRSRQRIHAGRMLSEFPGAVPDLRPEEARDAKAATDQVVRRIIDWLAEHPPT